MGVQDKIPVLDYQRNLYTHAFYYRSPQGIAIFIAVFLLAAAFAYVPFLCTAAPKPFSAIFAIGAALPGVAVLLLGFRILNNSKDICHFTTTGIEAHGKMVPWSRITRVAANGKESADLVQVFYTVQQLAGLTGDRIVFNGQSVTRDEYEKLIDLLQKELRGTHAHLKLGGYFSVTTN